MVAHSRLNPFSRGPISASEITELRVYPIKSCRGIKVTNSYLTKKGLDLDRRWMFVDAKTHRFVTIRELSHMTLIDTALTESADHPHTGRAEDQFLTISIRNTGKSVSVPARPTDEWLKNNTTLASDIQVWSVVTDGYVYGDEVNSIFSEFLSQDVALVYKGPTPRVLQANGAPEYLGREEHTNFADFFPVLVANEASLAELNERLIKKGSKPIPIERFRPNIVLKGALPEAFADDLKPGAWVEDRWKLARVLNEPASWFSDNSLDLDIVMRAARCQVPNVDCESAVKNEHEPWDTLVSYRRIDEGIKWKPIFGMLAIPRNEGKITTGMRFQVVEETDKHKAVKMG